MKAFTWIRNLAIVYCYFLAALITIKGANFKTTPELQVVRGEKAGY
jgi:hypothetical protein